MVTEETWLSPLKSGPSPRYELSFLYAKGNPSIDIHSELTPFMVIMS